MKHVTTSVAVNREIANMAETKAAPSKKDHARLIIVTTVLTVAGLITAACVVFGVNLN